MEYREIEVTILSAQDLKNVRLMGGTMSPYAKVWISSGSGKVQTGVHTRGGTNPLWNRALTLSCEDKLFRRGNCMMTVAVYDHGLLFNKLIGTATVPLSDLSAHCKAADADQPLGGSSAMSTPMFYEIRKSASGKARGVVNFAVKVGAIMKVKEHESDAPVAAYPPAGYSTGVRSDDRYYPPLYHAQYRQPDVYYEPPAYMRPHRRSGEERRERSGMGFGAAGLLGLMVGLLLGELL